MTGPRVGVDGLALRTGGGVTWIVKLIPALADDWPEASIEVLVRPEVTLPPGADARVTWTRRSVPSGPWRLPVEKFVVGRWVKRRHLDVVLVGADAGPVRLSCPFVQASLNAKPYTATGLRYRLLLRAARATARGAAATVFLSESHRRIAEPLLAPRRGLAIPAGVELPPAGPLPRLLADPYVLVVATGYAHKDLGTALRAVLALRAKGDRHRLVWAGLAVDAAVVEDLRRLARDDPSAFVEAGAVDQPSLEAWYRHADAVMLPSLEESGGLPVAEALARGVPVVASDIPAIAETAAGAARLHPPRDVARAATLLAEVFASPPISASARDVVGHAWAAPRSWAVAAGRYRAILEQAISER